jgi:hypothetical protein
MYTTMRKHLQQETVMLDPRLLSDQREQIDLMIEKAVANANKDFVMADHFLDKAKRQIESLRREIFLNHRNSGEVNA